MKLVERELKKIRMKFGQGLGMKCAQMREKVRITKKEQLLESAY